MDAQPRRRRRSRGGRFGDDLVGGGGAVGVAGGALHRPGHAAVARLHIEGVTCPASAFYFDVHGCGIQEGDAGRNGQIERRGGAGMDDLAIAKKKIAAVLVMIVGRFLAVGGEERLAFGFGQVVDLPVRQDGLGGAVVGGAAHVIGVTDAALGEGFAFGQRLVAGCRGR